MPSLAATCARHPTLRNVLLSWVACLLLASSDLSRLRLLGDVASQAAAREELSLRPIAGASADAATADRPLTRVLVARTVSPSEIPNVVNDVAYVQSFYAGRHEALVQKSRERCNVLKAAGYEAQLDPFINGTQTHPNHILCSSNDTAHSNYYWRVHVDFLLFARNMENVRIISLSIAAKSRAVIGGNTTLYDVQLNIKDVSDNPKKLRNWIRHCNNETLAGYDYVWFIDGDIPLRSLNWQAFWQQVMMLRPKIVQPSVIGNETQPIGTTHTLLRYHPDARLIAGFVPIVEVQAPLLEVETWLSFRDFIVAHQDIMGLLAAGGEACFDMAYCHLAMNGRDGIGLNGTQQNGEIQRVGYKTWAPTISLDDGANADLQEKGCLVLYQTPIVHGTHHTIVEDRRFREASRGLCRTLRLDHHVVGKGGLGNVYELFNAPQPTAK